MKKVILTLTIAIASFSYGVAQSLSIDTDKAKVTYSFIKEKVTGTVSGMDAKIEFNLADVSKSKISGSVDVSTLTSGNKMRDKHLMAEDYFNVKEFPTMNFESTSITKDGDNYIMVGKMTIKDITKEETIKFTYVDGVFIGKTVIFGKDYKVAKEKKEGDSKILIKFTVPAK